MNQPYVPISCAVHDELLALATLRRECELTLVRGDGRPERVRGIIADVYSRGGAEYLELRGGGTYRLDQIQALDGKVMPRAKPTTVAEYIEAAPPVAQGHLQEMRRLLREVAPEASEALKWGSPVFEDRRILFSYSAHKAHLGFVPTGGALEPFRAELAGYQTGEHSIRFPYATPLPAALIRRIAGYRLNDVRQNDARWIS